MRDTRAGDAARRLNEASRRLNVVAHGYSGGRTLKRIRTRLRHDADDVVPGGIIRSHGITMVCDLAVACAGTALLLTPRDPRATLLLMGTVTATLRVLRELRASFNLPRRFRDHVGTAVYVVGAPVVFLLTLGWSPLAVRAAAWLYLLAHLGWRIVVWWATITVVTTATLTRITSVFSDETPSIEIRHFGPKIVRRSILGRVLGYGTLIMDTPSRKDALLGYIPNIPDPYVVKEMLTNKHMPVDT